MLYRASWKVSEAGEVLLQYFSAGVDFVHVRAFANSTNIQSMPILRLAPLTTDRPPVSFTMAGMWGAHAGYQVNPQPTFPQASGSSVGYSGGALVQSQGQGQSLAMSGARQGLGGSLYGQPSQQQQQQMPPSPFSGSSQLGGSHMQGQMMLSQQQQQEQHAGPSQRRYSQQHASANDNPPQQSLTQQHQPGQYQVQAPSSFQQTSGQLVQRSQASAPAPVQASAQQPAQAPPTLGSDELSAEERALYEPLDAASRQITQAREDDEKIVPAFDNYLSAYAPSGVRECADTVSRRIACSCQHLDAV